MALPELIVFSENKLGGVQSYFYNLLMNDRENAFDKKWILYDDHLSDGAKLPAMFDAYPKEIIRINDPVRESVFRVARRLKDMISNREGIVLASFYHELATLHLYRKNNKHLFFFCHDEEYVQDAIAFEFLIDVFITHNITFYEKLRESFPSRHKDIFYLPYGIKISGLSRSRNTDRPLKLLVLSRITVNKGVYDLPVIDAALRAKGMEVDWTIIGNGPDLDNLKAQLSGHHVHYYIPEHAEEVLKLASQCDLYLLPSKLDGLPNALLEAMSVGCVPVISEFNKGIHDVVTEKEGYVLPVGDTAAFIKVIEVLNNNRNKLEEMSAHAKIKIIEEYDIKIRTGEYYNLFKQYKKYKRPYQFKSYKYLGFINHPVFPETIKKIYSRLRTG